VKIVFFLNKKSAPCGKILYSLWEIMQSVVDSLALTPKVYSKPFQDSFRIAGMEGVFELSIYNAVRGQKRQR
jgi:hypothetical protein